ncbi:MAG: glycosyltransferase family 87 protein [Acidimicrobiia bacterium]
MRWLRFAPVVLLIAVRVLFVGTVLDSPRAYNHGTAYEYDAERYHRIADQSGIPHRDFEVEFPPVSLAYIELVNGENVAETMQHLAWSAVVLDLLIAGALAYGWKRRAALYYLVLGLPFLVIPFVYFRIDLLSVALAIWGLALVKRHREMTGGVFLALAAFAKFWPLGLVPLLLVRRARTAFVSCAIAGGVGALAWIAWAGVAGPEQVLTFRGATGWHFESVTGSVVRVVTGSELFQQSGAIRTGSSPAWASALLGCALVGVVAATWWRTARSGAVDDRTIDGIAPLVATTTFLVFSPVLSPQYLVWLLPFAAICWATGARRLTALVAISVILTMLLTQVYGELKAAELGAEALLLARNAVLVWVLVDGLGAIGGRRSVELGVEAQRPAVRAMVAA